MRHYPQNSPEALARIVALALVADGRLETTELDVLTRSGALGRIGISEERFLQVLKDFCADLLAHRRQAGRDECQLDREDVARLLGDLDNPERQRAVLRTVLEVIRADGRLHTGESMLVWQALDQWRLRLTDLLRPRAERVVRYPRISRNPKRKKPRPQAPQFGPRFSGQQA
jgi:uncharacterized tellurite resistance protein B-like protein